MSTALEPPNVSKHRFNPELGLWSSVNKRTHLNAAELNDSDWLTETRSNSRRLINAAQSGKLQQEHALEILTGLARLQVRDNSPHHGNFPWFAELGRVTDTNAAFFIGLDLCALRLGYPEQLTPQQRGVLDELCAHLMVWFNRAVPEHAFHYPNKYLGDLVCCWMLHEINDSPVPPALCEATTAAADYWLANGWGWGEHLSDNYCKVMFNQLGVLLSLSANLPDELRRKFTTLFNDLVNLERAFAGGPRVPALRSYAFDKRPSYKPFFEGIRPLAPDEPARGYRHLLATRGLIEKVPVPAASATGTRQLRVPCLRGAVATAWISDHARIGSMSHFPIMPEAEYPKWGLSWQSFPVAWLAGETGWGFLRWRAIEKDVTRAHPAINQHIKQLSSALSPSSVGHTSSRQSNDRVVVVRKMPTIDTGWDALSDSIDLIGFDIRERSESRAADGSLVLRISGATGVWTFGHHPLVAGAQPRWIESGDSQRWEVCWDGQTLRDAAPPFRVAHLWWIASGDVEPPTVSKRQNTGPRFPELADESWTVCWPSTGDTSLQALDVDLSKTDVFSAIR